MTDTTLAPQRVTTQETDLLMIGILALENDHYQQCIGTLRQPNEQRVHCAEGVFAELLVQAYPERFTWLIGGELYDRRRVGDSGYASHSTLQPDHWNALHPHGAAIAERAAEILGSCAISAANDHGRSFTEIAGALRQARAEVEGER
jgi:hypothetical protein